MSDSVTKFYENEERKVQMRKASGDVIITQSEPMIHESPDGGKTVKSRPLQEGYTRDSVVSSLVDLIDSRAKVGKEKYGTTMDREDLSELEWCQHHLEELIDASLYTLKRIQFLKNKQ